MCTKNTKIIQTGSSYSLNPDGSPGTYNNELARIMKTDRDSLQNNGAKQLWCGMQWEICDALQNLGITVPDSHVASPPDFQSEEITNAEDLIELLRTCPTRATEILRNRLEVDLEPVYGRQSGLTGLNANNLVVYLNRILLNDDFFKDFYEVESFGNDGNKITITVCRVELHNLYRTNLGSVGVEKREMPAQDAKLGKFQTRRVNRLIIEAIFPNDGILQRMPYLSTYGVVNHFLPQIEKDLPGIKDCENKYVIVYGHPEHRERCKRQFIECAWNAGWNIEPGRVLIGGKGEQINIDTSSGRRSVLLAQWDPDKTWDPNTAQMWCRSKRNWEDYEAMGNIRLN